MDQVTSSFDQEKTYLIGMAITFFFLPVSPQIDPVVAWPAILFVKEWRYWKLDRYAVSNARLKAVNIYPNDHTNDSLEYD